MRQSAWVCLAAAWLTVSGCQSEPTTGPATKAMVNATGDDLSQGYSLLRSLLNDESDVAKILLVKTVKPETKVVIKDISTISKAALEDLDAFAKLDKTLKVGKPTLPFVEAAARTAIDWATTKQLLLERKEFERDLLLTQVQSMQYGAALAGQLSLVDKQPDRQVWLKKLAKAYADLGDRVTDRLEVR